MSSNIQDATFSPLLLAGKTNSIKVKVGDNLFIDAKTDVYLQNLVADDIKISTVVERLRLCAHAGANSGFIPRLSDTVAEKTLLSKLTISINLMINDNQEDIGVFSKIGFSRLSLGPKPFIDTYSSLATLDTLSNKTRTLEYSSINSSY